MASYSGVGRGAAVGFRVRGGGCCVGMMESEKSDGNGGSTDVITVVLWIPTTEATPLLCDPAPVGA